MPPWARAGIPTACFKYTADGRRRYRLRRQQSGTVAARRLRRDKRDDARMLLVATDWRRQIYPWSVTASIGQTSAHSATHRARFAIQHTELQFPVTWRQAC